MLSQGTKVALVIGLLAMGIHGVVYYRQQNRPRRAAGGPGETPPSASAEGPAHQAPASDGARAHRMGGAISRGKAVWLSYAIFLWFIVCPALAFDPRVPGALRILLGSFGLSMWLRGLVELYLLYIGRGWRPPYGVGHDLFCLALIGVEAVLLREAVVAAATDPLGWWITALLGVVVVSLIVEVGYAWAFFRVVGERTKGAQAIWFASADDPRFRTLVLVTAIINVPLCLFLAIFLAVGLGLTLHVPLR